MFEWIATFLYGGDQLLGRAALGQVDSDSHLVHGLSETWVLMHRKSDDLALWVAMEDLQRRLDAAHLAEVECPIKKYEHLEV